MRLFLEIERIATEEEERKGIPIPFIRIAVTTEDEARSRMSTLLPLIPGGEAYLHSCCHDEVPPGPCERKKL